MSYEVQKALIPPTQKGRSTKGARWTTISGYARKESAQREANQLRASYRKKGYRLRVVKT